jgi:hypothetical protein
VLDYATLDVQDLLLYLNSMESPDEVDMILYGFIAFLDLPKESAAPAIAALGAHGVAIKILTGDHELVARKVCRDVGLNPAGWLLGGAIEAMSDAELEEAAERGHALRIHRRMKRCDGFSPSRVAGRKGGDAVGGTFECMWLRRALYGVFLLSLVLWIAIVSVGGHPSDLVAVIKLEAAKLRALVAMVVSLAGLAASSQRGGQPPFRAG